MKKAWELSKTLLRGTDLPLLLFAIAATVFGLVFIKSATLSYHTNRNVMVQAAGALVGILGMVLVARIDYTRFHEFRWWIYGLCIGLLVLTLLIGTGEEETGNNSWIRFSWMPIGIQPSEFVKLGFAVTFAVHLERVRDHINRFLTLVGLLAHAGLIILLVAMQGDYGSALVFCFMMLCMLFAGGLSLWYLLGGVGLSVCALPLIWNYLLKPYHRNRILVVLYPELDPTGVGYQANQCKTAIGSGQLYGNGLFQGRLTQGDLIPAKHTDCIFAVIGEEGGLICCLVLTLLLLLLILRCFYLAGVSKDLSGSMICVGIGSMLLFQTFENIGMCLGIMPVVGITLPFISYGGSSIVALFWALGLCASVKQHHKTILFGERIS